MCKDTQTRSLPQEKHAMDTPRGRSAATVVLSGHARSTKHRTTTYHPTQRDKLKTTYYDGHDNTGKAHDTDKERTTTTTITTMTTPHE